MWSGILIDILLESFDIAIRGECQDKYALAIIDL